MALSLALVLEMFPVALQASGGGQGFPPTQMPSPTWVGSLLPGVVNHGTVVI